LAPIPQNGYSQKTKVSVPRYFKSDSIPAKDAMSSSLALGWGCILTFEAPLKGVLN